MTDRYVHLQKREHLPEKNYRILHRSQREGMTLSLQESRLTVTGTVVVSEWTECDHDQR